MKKINDDFPQTLEELIKSSKRPFLTLGVFIDISRRIKRIEKKLGIK
jgi:hypothetical protein